MASTPPATGTINPPPSPPAPVALIVAAVFALIAAILAFSGFGFYAGVAAAGSFLLDVLVIVSRRSATPQQYRRTAAVEDENQR